MLLALLLVSSHVRRLLIIANSKPQPRSIYIPIHHGITQALHLFNSVKDVVMYLQLLHHQKIIKIILVVLSSAKLHSKHLLMCQNQNQQFLAGLYVYPQQNNYKK